MISHLIHDLPRIVLNRIEIDNLNRKKVINLSVLSY